MPSMCIVCHGGRALPLEADGSFSSLTLKSAKYNQLEVPTFEFMPSGQYRKAPQESGIREINQMVRDSFLTMGQRSSSDTGFWASNFATGIAEDRYLGSSFSSDVFFENNVPAGWQQNAQRPEGVEELYKKVVEPHCISCHSTRGYDAGNDAQVAPVMVNGQAVVLGNAINFSSYEKFSSYSDLIIDYVYRRGVMPLSLRNYNLFWQDPRDKPSLLAAFLPGFNVLNDDGEIQSPGLPVAKPGEARISRSPVRLNAMGSYFANQYQWTLVSSPECQYCRHYRFGPRSGPPADGHRW